VSASLPLVSTVELTRTKAARSGGTAIVIAVTDAAAASPAISRIHVRPRGRLMDRNEGRMASGASQADSPGRQARPHKAAARRQARPRQMALSRQARARQSMARRQAAATRATSTADRHSPDRQ
jgi:hypothetical protein